MKCPECSEDFIPKIHNQRFCQNRCKTRFGNRDYAKRHPQWTKERAAVSYWRNKPLRKVWATTYRARRRVEIAASHKKWRDANKDRIKGYYAGTRALRKSQCFRTPIEDRITGEEWQQIVDRSKGRCIYCGQTPDKLTQDHVVPLSKGGTHTASNIVPACLPCNSSKGNKDLDEFLRRRA